MALSGLAVVAAVIYAIAAKELAGAVMLGVFSVALLYIATVLEHAGPYDHAEVDQDAEPELGPEHMLPGSWWPLVMAVGAAATLIGIKFAPAVIGIGAGVFLLDALEDPFGPRTLEGMPRRILFRSGAGGVAPARVLLGLPWKVDWSTTKGSVQSTDTLA